MGTIVGLSVAVCVFVWVSGIDLVDDLFCLSGLVEVEGVEVASWSWRDPSSMRVQNSGVDTTPSRCRHGGAFLELPLELPKIAGYFRYIVHPL